MNYDFSKQMKMLNVTIKLSKEFDFYSKVALGGGTALAYCWNHRYSTDIDIFIYDQSKEHIKNIRPSNWSKELHQSFIDIGYENSFKMHPIYTEFEIDDECKIQLFDKIGFTDKRPYKKKAIWGLEINVESIEEIVAKKIFYRASKNNARDIFDIAVAINKNPSVLISVLDSDHRFSEKFKILENALTQITENQILFDTYKSQIEEMLPALDYALLSKEAPRYLLDIVQQVNYLNAIGIIIEEDDIIQIENTVMNEINQKEIQKVLDKIEQDNSCTQSMSL